MLHSRAERVAESIKVEVGQILDRELQNPNLPEFITVHSVKLSRDLRQAEIFVTFLKDEDKQVVAKTVVELNRAAGFIRGLLAGRVRLKYLPQLHFHYNPSTRYAAKLESIFHEIETTSPATSETAEPEAGKESSAQ